MYIVFAVVLYTENKSFSKLVLNFWKDIIGSVCQVQYM
jgi:hypothetical protein